MRLFVRLKPNAAKNAVLHWDQDEQGRDFLHISVRAQPIEGKANDALIALLSDTLKLSRSKISLVRGDTARLKQIDITTDDEAAVMARLNQSCAKS